MMFLRFKFLDRSDGLCVFRGLMARVARLAKMIQTIQNNRLYMKWKQKKVRDAVASMSQNWKR